MEEVGLQFVGAGLRSSGMGKKGRIDATWVVAREVDAPAS